MAQIIDSLDFDPKSSHSYLLDTNILILAFAPIGNFDGNKQRQALNFIEKCRISGSSMITTSLILSEFQNVLRKSFFNDFLGSNHGIVGRNPTFKGDYRISDIYSDDNLVISALTNSILKICDKYSDDFSSINMDNIISNTLNCDFNDAYYIELANNKNWLIVTRDSDIINSTSRKTPVVSFHNR